MVQTPEQIATTLVDLSARFDVFKYFFWSGVTLSITTSLATIGLVITHVIRQNKTLSKSEFEEFKIKYEGEITDIKNHLNKIENDEFAKLSNIKKDLRGEQQAANTKIFEMQEHDTGIIFDKIDELNKGREENKMCIKELKGEIKTMRAICGERHPEEK